MEPLVDKGSDPRKSFVLTRAFERACCAGARSVFISDSVLRAQWDGNFSTSTHFGGDTGSVSPTPSGVYAFWPIMGGAGKGTSSHPR